MVDQAEIHRMVRSEDVEERKRAVEKLKDNFAILEDKKQAWDDLHCLISDNDYYVKQRAVNALASAFSHVHDKEQAWADLHKLTQDKDKWIREYALDTFIFTFHYVPNKHEAYEDLHRLINDPDNYVRWAAADALGSVFSHVPDKKQAWDDLHRLTSDNDSGVRRGAAKALGSAFSQVPDKKQAWDDLIHLTSDIDEYVRIDAYPSSGKVCIFKASEAESEDVFKEEMENAIEFFEKASKESIYNNPAKFCLPFYRSFYTLTFEKENAESEVEKYIAEAKSVIAHSESKEKLLEAVENLRNALKEAQKARDLNETKADLNAIRRYCDHACELLDTTEEKAPGASRVIRKGLPIIDGTIKEILGELKSKSREVCIQTKDKLQNKLAVEIYSEINKLDADNPVKFDYHIELLIESLKMKIPNVKGNEHIIENIEALRILSDSDYKSLISKLIPIIGAIPQVVIGRDQINIKEFKGSLNTGDIVESLAKR